MTRFLALWLAGSGRLLVYCWPQREGDEASRGCRIAADAHGSAAVWRRHHDVRRVLAGPYLAMRYLPRALWLFWLGFALVAIGLGFSVSCAHLARRANWSGLVTLKQDHELIPQRPL